MVGGLTLLRILPAYAWGVFILAWIQMGWADWTQQKIRNRYLALWLKFVAAGYAVLIGHTLLGMRGLIPIYLLKEYYVAVGGYVAVSALSAYVSLGLCIWPAGDVKLFTLLALCYGLMRLPARSIPACARWRSHQRFHSRRRRFFSSPRPSTSAPPLQPSEGVLHQLGARKAAHYLLLKAVESWRP